MLKCNIYRKKNRIRVKGNGTAHDIMLETCCLINSVYRNISAAAPDAANGFKDALIGMLLDPQSPVWKTDERNKMHEK